MRDSTTGEGRLDETELKTWIRDVPDFPKPGIVFKDITPLLLEPRAFRSAIGHMADTLRATSPELLVGIDARGFIFASALALELGIGMAPVRKPGKLPWTSVSESYALEYGSDELHLHDDAFSAGTRVAVVDDLLATGGTAGAVARLVEKVGGEITAFCFLVELSFLHGRKQLDGHYVHSVLTF